MASVVAPFEKLAVSFWIALFDPHPPVPLVRDPGQPRVEGTAQTLDQIGERVSEVAILALAEAMACHVDVAAEMLFMRVEGGDICALSRSEKLLDHGAAVGAQVGCYRVPIAARHPLLGGDAVT